MQRCWLFYGDAWGFADFARRYQDDALKRLRYVASVVKKLRTAHASLEYFVFSDTIVCVRELPDATSSPHESTSKGFEDILVAVQFMISQLISADILLRGVITFGQLHREKNNEVIIGDALIDAAEFERETVAPPLVFLPTSTLVKARNESRISQMFYKRNTACSMFVNTKDGGVIRAQPLLGDKPEMLRQSLQTALEKATLSERPSARSAGALKAALDMADVVLKKRGTS